MHLMYLQAVKSFSVHYPTVFDTIEAPAYVFLQVEQILVHFWKISSKIR